MFLFSGTSKQYRHSKQEITNKNVQKSVRKLHKWSFLIKKVGFLKKNTNKIETKRPGDLKLGLNKPLEYPLNDQNCF